MNKSSLGIHEVKLVVQPGPGLHDGGGVGEGADGSMDLSEVTARDHCGGLVVDTNLEASGTPVNELDVLLVFNGSYGGIDVLGNDISSVE